MGCYSEAEEKALTEKMEVVLVPEPILADVVILARKVSLDVS